MIFGEMWRGYGLHPQVTAWYNVVAGCGKVVVAEVWFVVDGEESANL